MIKSGDNLDKKKVKYSNYLTAEFKMIEFYDFYKSYCLEKKTKSLNYEIYSKVIKEYNKEVVDLIIDANVISFGSLSTIRIIEKQRPLFINEGGKLIGIVDWPSTRKLNEIDPITGKYIKVYYEDPEIHKISWNKNICSIKNSRVYSFKAAKSFRRLLAKKIKSDNLITLQYRKNS